MDAAADSWLKKLRRPGSPCHRSWSPGLDPPPPPSVGPAPAACSIPPSASLTQVSGHIVHQLHAHGRVDGVLEVGEQAAQQEAAAEQPAQEGQGSAGGYTQEGGFAAQLDTPGGQRLCLPRAFSLWLCIGCVAAKQHHCMHEVLL